MRLQSATTPFSRWSSGVPLPAFTVIELIAVIVIAAIASVVALPSLAGVTSMRRSVAASQLARDLQYARERAISTGARTWVVLSTSTNSYSVLQESTSNPGRVGAVALSDTSNTGGTFVQRFGTGDYAAVSIQTVAIGTGSEIGFDWMGKPYDSTSTALTTAGVITLSGSKTVTIQPVTGAISTP